MIYQVPAFRRKSNHGGDRGGNQGTPVGGFRRKGVYRSSRSFESSDLQDSPRARARGRENREDDPVGWVLGPAVPVQHIPSSWGQPTPDPARPNPLSRRCLVSLPGLPIPERLVVALAEWVRLTGQDAVAFVRARPALTRELQRGVALLQGVSPPHYVQFVLARAPKTWHQANGKAPLQPVLGSWAQNPLGRVLQAVLGPSGASYWLPGYRREPRVVVRFR